VARGDPAVKLPKVGSKELRPESFHHREVGAEISPLPNPLAGATRDPTAGCRSGLSCSPENPNGTSTYPQTRSDASVQRPAQKTCSRYVIAAWITKSVVIHARPLTCVPPEFSYVTNCSIWKFALFDTAQRVGDVLRHLHLQRFVNAGRSEAGKNPVHTLGLIPPKAHGPGQGLPSRRTRV